MLDPSSPSSGQSLRTGPLDDFPPSYDEAEASQATDSIAGDGGDGGESSAAARKWPESLDALFDGPANAEPMITHDAAARIPDIKIHKTYHNRIEVCDSRLDTNAEALYDFIRTQCRRPPSVQIRCSASRMETSPRQQTVVRNGVPTVVQAGQPYRVTDFDFTIDLNPIYAHEDTVANVHLIARRPDQVVTRGQYNGMFGASHNKKFAEAYAKFRRERGRPIWTDMASDEEFWAQYDPAQRPGVRLGGRSDRGDEEALLGQQREEDSLRHWCEAYVNDPGLLKSFQLTKDVWGWDLANLRAAIERAIISTGYEGMGDTITVDYMYGSDSVVVVRSDNLISKLYNYPPFLLMFFFFWIFPFIWLWHRFDTERAGRAYDAAVASYGMKFYPPLPNTFRNESIEQAQHRLPAMYKLHPEVPKHAFLNAGPKGVHYLLGRREGEWFREWEERIRTATRLKFQGELTNTRIFDDEEPPELDGY